MREHRLDRTRRAGELRGTVVAIAFATAALLGCQGEPAAEEPAPETPSAPADAAAPEPGASPAETAPAPLPIPETGGSPSLADEPALAGATGPVELTLTSPADQYAGPVVSDAVVGLVWRGELPGDECTESDLERCHPWTLSSAPREGGETTARVIAEIDSPSGIDLEAILPVGDGLVVVWREGRYAGDLARAMVAWLHADGEPRRAAFDALGGASSELRNLAVTATGDERLLLCFAGDDAGHGDTVATLERKILCRVATPEGVVGAIEVTGGARGRHRAPALAWSGERGLLTWVRDGQLEAVVVDETGQALTQPIALGQATARQPALVAGHGGYLVVWQHTEGHLVAQRIEADGRRVAADPVPLGGDTPLAQVMPSGASAVPQGFLIAVNPDADARLVLVPPAGDSAPIAERVTGRQVWLAHGAAVLLPTDAEPLAATWQSAASLLP